MILPNSTHHQMVPILTLEILWILAWIYGEILRIETIQHSLNMQNLNSIYHPRHPLNHIYDERERERERENPFSRSYEVILLSSFVMVLSSALIYSLIHLCQFGVSSLGGSLPPNLKYQSNSFGDQNQGISQSCLWCPTSIPPIKMNLPSVMVA